MFRQLLMRTLPPPPSITETPHLAQDLEDRRVAAGDTVALQCKALGSPPPRITWLRDDQPLRPSDRHHFTPGNQLLVISPASMEDAGRYTCLMSNTLGTERAHSQLVVSQPRGLCSPPAGLNTVTIGVIVIAVVTSIVVTSLVWVCIIYQTRKKSEECSVTNTGEPALTTGAVPLWRRRSCFKRLVFAVPDETIVPPDVPSYLSSQGTLSERQDVCIRVEAGGGPQPNGHLVDTAGTAGAPRQAGAALDSSLLITRYLCVLQPSTVPFCAPIAWRTAAVTPKTPTT